MKNGVFLLITLALTLPLGAQAPASPPTVAQVLARCAAASGADAAGVRTVCRQGTLVRGNLGKVPFEMVSAENGRWYYNQVFAYGDQTAWGCDGRETWICDNRGFGIPSPAEKLDLQLILDWQAAGRLAAIFPDLAVAGTGKAGDRETVTLTGKTREGVTVELVFDRHSGLLLQAGRLYFEDYRPEGPLKLPRRIFVGADPGEDGLRMKLEVTVVHLGEAVPPDRFTRPTCPLPAVKAPLFTLRRQVVVNQAAMQACVGVYQHSVDAKIQFTVSLQGDHLMMERTGWGRRVEIKPESELDYFIRFRNIEVHFVKGDDGRVMRLEIGPDRATKAQRVQ